MIERVAGEMLIEYEPRTVVPALSFSVMVGVNVPDAVGVPEIEPAAEMDSPFGRPTADQV